MMYNISIIQYFIDFASLIFCGLTDLRPNERNKKEPTPVSPFINVF